MRLLPQDFAHGLDLPYALVVVVNSRHDVGPYTGLKHGGVMSDDHECQAQRIAGERQTSSGLEYEVSVQKTLGLWRGCQPPNHVTGALTLLRPAATICLDALSTDHHPALGRYP